MADDESKKLRTQVERSRQEIAWLRDELAKIQQKLGASEQAVQKLQQEKRYLEFMYSLPQYDKDDEDPPGKDDNAKERTNDGPAVDRFPEGEAEERNGRSTSPTPPSECERSASETRLETVPEVNADLTIPACLRTSLKLVRQYLSEGLDEDAVTLCKQLIEDNKRKMGHDHPNVSLTLVQLAAVYQEQKKYSEAENLLNNALAIQEKRLGKNHLIVSATRIVLATVYGKSGKYEEAERVSRRSLEIQEEVLGRDHPYVATSLHKLAELWYGQDKYEKAQEYYQRAIEIYETNDSVEMKKNLGACYYELGKYKDAEAIYKEILTRTEPDEGNVIQTKKDLGASYFMQGKYKDAKVIFKQILPRIYEIYEAKLGPDHPIIVTMTNVLAVCYVKLNKPKNAEVLLKLLLTRAHEKKFGAIDADNKSIWQVAEELEKRKKKRGKKETTENAPYKIYSSTLIPALKTLGIVYEEQGKHTAADTLIDCALKSEKEA